MSIEGIKLLHKKMFDLTWKWAGKFRTYDTNLGVGWRMVPEELKKLCDDVRYWGEQKTFHFVEFADRFHQRLVAIHPFPKGNGRVRRLAADLFLEFRSQPSFVWGAEDLSSDSRDRKEYLATLREADKGKYRRLMDFAQGKT